MVVPYTLPLVDLMYPLHLTKPYYLTTWKKQLPEKWLKVFIQVKKYFVTRPGQKSCIQFCIQNLCVKVVYSDYLYTGSCS